MTALYYKTIAELAPLLEKKELSPVELLQSIFSRIDDLDSKLNSYITLLRDEALESAKKAETEIMAGHYKGQLHGIPIGLKDLFYTKGIRTTAGSAILKDFVPQYNATVVERLLGAGVVLTGKLNMHEYAFGATNENSHFGDAHNPWNFDHITGGSSGGSAAAVAAGLSVASLGSDTGGSIRTPSALCGVVGLKPTFGRVSKYGVVPLAWSLDHIGPIARGVEDIAIILEEIAGYDPKDPTTKNKPVESYRSELFKGIDGLKIGVPMNYYFDDTHPEVETMVRTAIQALQSLGGEIVEVTIPELALSMFAEIVTISSEASAYHHETLVTNAVAYGDDVRLLLEGGELFSAVQYVKAQQARRVIQEGFKRTFQQVDVLIAPTVPIMAPRIGERQVEVNGKFKDPVMEFVRLAAPCNLTGLPSVSVPVGLSSSRLPVAMQIIGKPFDESTILRVAAAYEKEFPLNLMPIE
ncbi:amidase [Desulfurispora thermophila]|uniref:amidase n=1 Tax=Desulfurispora thermophila TaxID=265470 RepID=UPI00037F06CB|nr:amidase [Desulfurispora thermophila]